MLHYQTHVLEPQAEWVVFIHGAGGNMTTWKYQVEAFKPFFNLLLLDLRGHGASQSIEPEYPAYNFDIVTDDVLEVIDHLGIQRAHFLSLSLGSVVLQKLTEKRPEVVDKIVMAGGIFRATPTLKLFVYSAKLLSRVLPFRVLYDIFSWVVLPRKNHQYSRRIFRLQSRKISPPEFLKWVAIYRDFFGMLRRSFKHELRQLSLIVMGEQDHIFLQAAQRFASIHPLAQLAIIERCGHVCNIEQYERFNQMALDFLRGNVAYMTRGADSNLR